MDNDLNIMGVERSSFILYNGGLNPLSFTYEGHGKRSPILYIQRVYQYFPHGLHVGGFEKIPGPIPVGA